MQFKFLVSALAAIATVNAATNTTLINEITQALQQGDFVDAAKDILTLGDCQIANLAGI
jgi:hypothetical protein